MSREMTPKKIAMIGAGSVVFCKTLISDILATDALKDSEFALMSPTETKLRRMEAFVRRMIENAESADEIMVDTMYEVWKTAGRFRGDSRVTTWILGIARNKVLMAMRSRSGAHHEDIEEEAAPVRQTINFMDVLKRSVEHAGKTRTKTTRTAKAKPASRGRRPRKKRAG